MSAGWRTGAEALWAVMSDSGSGMKETGRLRLSLYPISPRLVGNGSACGRTSVGPWETVGEEGERVAMTSRVCVRRVACAWQVCREGEGEEPGLVNWGLGEKGPERCVATSINLPFTVAQATNDCTPARFAHSGYKVVSTGAGRCLCVYMGTSASEGR